MALFFPICCNCHSHTWVAVIFGDPSLRLSKSLSLIFIKNIIYSICNWHTKIMLVCTIGINGLGTKPSLAVALMGASVCGLWKVA